MVDAESDSTAAELSDAELREIAREAGLTPTQLRKALAERNSPHLAGLPARPRWANTPWPRTSSLHGRVALPPEVAAARVVRSLEGAVGAHGRVTGDHGDMAVQNDGVTYKVCAERDGEGGSLVEVELDPSTGVANHVMLATIVAALSTTVMLLGGLFSSTVLAVGAAMGLLGGLLVLRQAWRLGRILREATTTAAGALVDAEFDAIGAPPGI